MKLWPIFLALVFSMQCFATSNIDKVQKYLGSFELIEESVNTTEAPCSRDLVVKLWEDRKLLDLQFIDLSEGIVFQDENPITRAYLKNSYVFDLDSSVFYSPKKKFKTTTQIWATSIEEKTFKKKWASKKYKLVTGASTYILGDELTFEMFNRKGIYKQCIYLRLESD